jgi:hypothetical protein
MLKFELAYSLLYQNKIATALESQQSLFIDNLNLESSKLLYCRFNDPQLIVGLAESIKIQDNLQLSEPITLNEALTLLSFELITRQAPHNCFIWQGSLHSNLTGTIIRTEIPDCQVEPKAISNLVLAHGLRWGWTIEEFIGRSIIVNAEKQVLIDYSGCSCKVKNCSHYIFADAVRKDRLKLHFCIKLTNFKLI